MVNMQSKFITTEMKMLRLCVWTQINEPISKLLIIKAECHSAHTNYYFNRVQSSVKCYSTYRPTACFFPLIAIV